MKGLSNDNLPKIYSSFINTVHSTYVDIYYVDVDYGNICYKESEI